MGAQTSRFANVLSQIKQIKVIFTHLNVLTTWKFLPTCKLRLATATRNFQVGKNLYNLI